VPVQNLALDWQQSAVVAAGLAVAGLGLRRARSPRVRPVAPFGVEAFVIAALYSLWQLAGEVSVAGTTGAYARARWIERAEHDLRLPSERDLQHLILGHRLLVESANWYYATAHFTVLGIFLVWLFVRHRDRYPHVRNVLAVTTLVCLVIQLLPVAPPRMLPGFVDTAVRYGESVYSTGLAPDVLSAMPSVHVAWAVLVGWYAVRSSRSRWRWLGVAHAAATVFVVVSTANHWWADGVVGTGVLVASAWSVTGVSAWWRRVRADRLARDVDNPGAGSPLSDPPQPSIVQA